MNTFFRDGNIFINNDTDINYILDEIILPAYPAEEGSNLFIQTSGGLFYHLSNSKNELSLLKSKLKNINNMSIINLGECERLLKKEYHINETDSLIFVKSENKSNNISEKSIKLKIYEPYYQEELNLSICDETNINIINSME